MVNLLAVLTDARTAFSRERFGLFLDHCRHYITEGATAEEASEMAFWSSGSPE